LQIAKAVGEGQTASLSAVEYLDAMADGSEATDGAASGTAKSTDSTASDADLRAEAAPDMNPAGEATTDV
jgi:hypothetical protein